MNDPSLRGDAMSFLRAPEIVAKELIARPGFQDHSTLLARAQKRARVLGVDLRVVLAKDAERLNAFPTAECLTPPEVIAICAGETSSSDPRFEHASSCEFCARILEAARPNAEQRERFLDELGSLAARAASSAESAQIDQPIASCGNG